MRSLPFLFCSFFLFSCSQKPAKELGTIERLDPSLDNVINKNAKIEIIAEGFEWSEGPLWIDKEKMLLFSDVFKNIVYKWTEERGKEKYLEPSGYTDTVKRGGEIGSNGLTLRNDGKLVLCQHGNRQVAVMNTPVENPKPDFTSLANRYNAKRFNSPNDLVYDAKGNLFFTDPPYGLEKNMDDSSKEIPFQGVYKVSPGGEVSLLIDSISRPNGIALTADGKRMIIANSDPTKAVWYQYDVTADDSLTNGRIFYDATSAAKLEQGNPDGLKIDREGNVFASGPGGLWIFNNSGKPIGKIKFPEKVSNCAFSTDEKTLFITADNYVLRVKMRK